ncbi:hypothetical protein [Ornithinimicrobium avium]|uniref:Uncharacterized protein n=1 Tax=Ornithinimicrobium avium TaxID=2283195 RepID=A0A345NQR9_9MICO|nr:hypothetical protein [Ornithinimicrobium avium]AXH97377.1 hypothetical protein DV701_15780 [Ornithinimicrobium avium]
MSQEGPVGSGTAADPWLVTTVVDLGHSGVRLIETDTYVAGQRSYLTRVRLSNDDSDQGVSATIYRAGDCYVADSDYG